MQFCCSTNKYATTKTNALLSKWITVLEQQENMACSTQIRECMSSNTILKESWNLIRKKTFELKNGYIWDTTMKCGARHPVRVCDKEKFSGD